MTTRARASEADRASAAFQTALSQIGVGTVTDALRMWHDVPLVARPETTTSWLRRAIELVMNRRSQSRELARAYYRLARALRTGTTVADPYHPEPRYITLDVLRREFAALAGTPEQPQEGRASGSTSQGTDSGSEPVQTPVQDAGDDEEQDSSDDGNDRILVEEIKGLREQEEANDRAAREELARHLTALGPKNLGDKLKDIDTSAPADDVDRRRAEAHAQAGARQAAAAERIALNGGRSQVWTQSERDKRVIGYIRLSRTGTPCGWCAMLISRGPVYRSSRSAEYGDGDKYHDNCHCYAEPVFSREQFNSSPLYALNRRYQELWPQVTKGLSGDAALTAWRRFIRTEQKAAAQEARRQTHVQEA